MTCARLEEVLCEAPTADALAHAKRCAECGPARAAWDAMHGSPAASASLDKMREVARAELRANPKARMWWVDATMLLAINLGVVGIATFALSTSPAHVQPATSCWGIAAALLSLIGVGAWAAVRPGAQPLRLALLAIAALGAIWVGLGGSGLSPNRPFGAGIACAVTEGVVSAIPLLVALWITSRFAFDSTRAIVGGLSVGATGMFVLHLHCIDGGRGHLFTFHVLPWALVALAALAIRRMMPSRSYAG